MTSAAKKQTKLKEEEGTWCPHGARKATHWRVMDMRSMVQISRWEVDASEKKLPSPTQSHDKRSGAKSGKVRNLFQLCHRGVTCSIHTFAFLRCCVFVFLMGGTGGDFAGLRWPPAAVLLPRRLPPLGLLLWNRCKHTV
jgi:hypothetical protein